MVDTSRLPGDPLDDDGFQKVRVGDHVLVSGTPTVGFFGPRRELEATALVTLQQDPDKELAVVIE